MTSYLGVFCTRDPASRVQGQVYDYDKRRHVPAAIRDFRGRVGSLRLAFTTAVVRMTTGVPLDSDINDVDDAATARAFRSWLGRALLLDDGSPDPRTIEAAFDRVYVRPQQNVAPGLTGRVAYDTLFRAWTANYAEKVALVLDHADVVAQKSRELTLHEGSPGFNGVEFQAQAARLIFPDGKGAQGKVSAEDVGTVIRRTADGSLPVLLKILRKVLADYDPATSARLGARLQYR
ncbi:MAG TPA: hypothetical protein VN903_00390 [Polyangia bacterium]|nr:hypothetical protein [Polyangia bacterium]